MTSYTEVDHYTSSHEYIVNILALWRTSLPVASRPATCLFCLFISIEESPMQKILIIGYLGRDPELKYSPQGAVIAQFSIASTERWKDKNGDSRNAPSGSA